MIVSEADCSTIVLYSQPLFFFFAIYKGDW